MAQSNHGSNLRFAVDMITLYDRELWDVPSFYEFFNPDVLDPSKFWDKALDLLEGTGIDGVRLTFGPSYWRNAVKRFGSGGGLAAALGDRGLQLAAGFSTSLSRAGWEPEDKQQEILDEAKEYAEFLAEANCETMVVGLPPRTTWDKDDHVLVDLEYAKRLSDLLQRMGYETLKRGVKLALHPKTHGVFWLRRDIDLFLLLTDPVYVYFCPDTAHITLGGGDPVQVVRDYASRIIVSDWKDALEPVAIHYEIDDNHLTNLHPHYARIGLGRVDWAGLARAFRDSQFKGWAILELDAASDPRRLIADARQFVEDSVLPIYR